MAEVTLYYLYLNQVSSMATELELDLEQIGESIEDNHQIRRQIDGTYRVFISPGASHTIPVNLGLVTRTDGDQIRTWAETTTLVQLRDPLGRKIYGVIDRATLREEPMTDDTATIRRLSFSLREVTWSEAV
jgi:hypothetical protein